MTEWAISKWEIGRLNWRNGFVRMMDDQSVDSYQLENNQKKHV